MNTREDKALELLKKIKTEWDRKIKAGEKLSQLEMIYLEAIDYILGLQK